MKMKRNYTPPEEYCKKYDTPFCKINRIQPLNGKAVTINVGTWLNNNPGNNYCYPTKLKQQIKMFLNNNLKKEFFNLNDYIVIVEFIDEDNMYLRKDKTNYLNIDITLYTIEPLLFSYFPQFDNEMDKLEENLQLYLIDTGYNIQFSKK